jgi:hypothetical protein
MLTFVPDQRRQTLFTLLEDQEHRVEQLPRHQEEWGEGIMGHSLPAEGLFHISHINSAWVQSSVVSGWP